MFKPEKVVLDGNIKFKSPLNVIYLWYTVWPPKIFGYLSFKVIFSWRIKKFSSSSPRCDSSQLLGICSTNVQQPKTVQVIFVLRVLQLFYHLTSSFWGMFCSKSVSFFQIWFEILDLILWWSVYISKFLHYLCESGSPRHISVAK